MKSPSPQDWVPDVPLARWAPEDLAYAQRLHRALASAWSRFADRSMGGGEVEALGCADYRREFGHHISPRHWRRLVAMVRARGGGRGADLDPLTVYQPKRLSRTGADLLPASGAVAAASPEMEPLLSAIQGVNDIRNPSPDERAFLWGRAFEHFEAGIAGGKSRLAWKRSILGWLHVNVGSLAGTLPSLRRLWDVKHPLWLKDEKNPNALRDKRAVEKKKRLPEADILAIQAQTALGCGGRTAQGFREARALGLLSEETAARFTDSPSRKSYVPDAVRREVQPMLGALADHHRGPRTAKLNGPYLTLDWSKVWAADWYTADDLTAPVYYWIESEKGPALTRGQVLAMQDVRSKKILDFLLFDEKHYDSIRVRRLMNQVCTRWGLPRKGFLFEGGIWENSKIVTGSRGRDPSSWGEIETGFRALGLDFRHARTPRAKPIERAFGALQSRMESLPGYCGRNEMVDRFERLHQDKLQVGSGRKHPAECGFMSADEWMAALSAICEEFNATRLESPATGGMSPDDAFRLFQEHGNPQASLPPEARYLLATHRSIVSVDKRGGIRLGPGGRYRYMSQDSGALVGQQVLAWFDPEDPQFCTVTDLARRNPIVIPLAPTVPAVVATREEMKAGKEATAGHSRPVRERYSKLKAAFIPKPRENIVSPSVVELGRQMQEQKEAQRTAQREVASLRASVRSATGNLAPDLADPLAQSLARDPARAKAALELQRLLDSETTS